MIALTGLVLVTACFVMLWQGYPGEENVALTAAGLAGFELFFFAQDISKRWRRRNG
jgi:hypothetical protein